jgi:cytochrome P450
MGLALEEPVLAGPKIPERELSLYRRMQVSRDNQMAAFPRAAYEEPVYVLKSFLGTGYFINDPAGIKRVLLDNVANYPKAPMEREALGAAFGDGILVSEGETWKSHRRIMAPSFDFKSLVSYAPAMTECSLDAAQGWDRKGAGTVINIADEMTHLALKIISRTMFSTDAERLGGLVDGAMRRGQDLLSFGLLDILPLIGPPRMRRKLARVRATFAEMDGVMHGLIQSRAAAGAGSGPKDLLDRLVAARDSETGSGLSDGEIRDELVIIFLAGHETTALAMTYVWYLLSQHPQAEAKLHAELDAVLGGRAPVHDDLANLPYTRMVIEEAMRLYPPAPGLSGRQAQEEDAIAGQRIPKGAMVLITPWVVHRHRALWNAPERFDPERFSPERSAGRPRFAYMPFGGGPRVCIGAALAMTEASLILATMAQRYRLRLVPGQDIVLQHRVTMRPRDGIKMILCPRKSS